jgi:hypothetical protein
VSRLLHDDTLHLIDRVAGCMVLLFGQQQSRIAAMTTDQITQTGDTVTIRFGRHDVPVPEPLGELLLQLIHDGKSHVGIGSPTQSRWLFPGGVPGRPSPPPASPTGSAPSASPARPDDAPPSPTSPHNSRPLS